VYAKREQEPFIDAKVVFRHILENCASQLAMQTADFKFGSYGLRLFSQDPHSYADGFVSLVDKSIRLGLTDSLTPALEESRSILECATSLNGRETAIAHFLHCTAIKLQENGVSPTPTLKAFFETFLRNGVLKTKPTYPTRQSGWTHKPRGCGASACRDCAALDAFLLSETERIGRFQMGKQRRYHLSDKLPGALFNTTTDTKVAPHTLVVTKIRKEFDSELLSYNSEVQVLEARISPLKGEYMKNLLGCSAYDELILLDDIKVQDPGTAATGKKRTIEYTSDHEGRARQKRKR
jgi:hypothetical protein